MVRQSAVIIGMVTRDILVFVDSLVSSVQMHSGYGGVLHAASACVRNGVPVDLVSCLDEAGLSAVSSSLGTPGLLELSYVSQASNPLPRCSLFWAPDAAEPIEQTTTNGESIPHEHVLAVAHRRKAHSLYVNMTTGHDLRRRTIEEVSEHGFRIYFDPHMLLYSSDSIGARFLRPPDDWRQWLAVSDVLQLNEVEFAALCDLAQIRGKSFHEGAVELVQQLRSLSRIPGSPWALIRTKRDRVDVIFDDGHHWHHENRLIVPAPVPHPAYTIGCGDAFGAGVFCGLLTSWDISGLLSGLDAGIEWARESSKVVGLYLDQGDDA